MFLHKHLILFTFCSWRTAWAYAGGRGRADASWCSTSTGACFGNQWGWRG